METETQEISRFRRSADDRVGSSAVPEEGLRRLTDSIPAMTGGIIDSTPALIHTALPDGSIDYFNQTWLKYIGLPLEDLQGWKWTSAIHPADLEGILERWRASLASGEPFLHECRVRRADGAYRWMLHHKTALRDKHGAISRWYGASVDIEDRKRAEEEVGRLKERLERENIVLREVVDAASTFDEIIGCSPALQFALSRISKVAPTETTVLITGETGSGKELVARCIHKRSGRSAHPFVSVNCGAIPTSLISAELFGHEKGAFTGAVQRRLGRFELAEGGTLFLDEVGDLPAEIQVALLRVLQEKEFDRVGGSRPIRANVRLIAATNRDFKSAIAEGKFRNDLFYRLNVFPIEMPSLRERKEDIPNLTEYFIGRYAAELGKKISRISKRTMDLFQSYSWPGNIRELQNVIERSLIICESDTFSVDECWLARESRENDTPTESLSLKLARDEKSSIEAALVESKGRVSGRLGAAERLGIPASTLESRIRALNINKYQFKTAQQEMA